MIAGTKLGSYEIIAALGAGGMGEVYRARDTRLNRDVAIKILPEAVAADADRVARFTREAQTLAALNHPQIAQIYGVEEQGGTRALVMELVEGETLADRIARGPLPIDDGLPIARQIAEALEAAHEAGIVHRDLKPANVKLRPDGTVKVLDFGLAKAAQEPRSGSHDPRRHAAVTVTSPAVTAAGIILGTAAYMSPEQARGKPVDKRADLWAFGCVLYEMLTGELPFPGSTVTDVIAGVMKSDPDWRRLPPETPPAIRRLLHRTLQKDPHDRLRDAGDARLEIAQAKQELGEPAVAAVTSRSRPYAIALATLPLLTLAVGVATGLLWQRSQAAPQHWAATQLGGPRIAFFPRLSPDGRLLAFLTLTAGQSQVAVMNADSGDWSVLTSPTAVGPIVSLSWSRDSTRVYFDRSASSGRQIYSVSPLGGEPRLVLEKASFPEPLPDGSLLFLRINGEGQNQLHRFWPESGREQSFPVHVHASFLPSLRAFPDGREAAVFGRVVTGGRPGPLQVLVIDLESGRARMVAPDLVLTGVGSESPVPIGVSHDGRRILTAIREGVSSALVSIPRDGSASPAILFTTTRLITSVDEDADGRVYVDQVDRSVEQLRYPLSGGVPERLASLPTLNEVGALTLSDGRIVYATVLAGRQRLVAGRPGEELLPFVETQEQARAPLARLSDSEFLFLAGTREQPVVAIASAESGRVVRRLEGTRGRAISRLAVSVDGKTIYFATAGEIFSLPAGDGEPRVVTRGTGIAIDPQGRFMIIDRTDSAGSQILRRDNDGTETRLTLPPGVRATTQSVWPRSLNADGQLLFVAESDNSWFWRPALFDLRTNQVKLIPVSYAGDAEVDAAWDGDHVTVLARRLESAMWRFTRAK